MRLYWVLLLLIITNEIYCEDLNKPLPVLTYMHGCRGNCNYSYDDSCGIDKDSIFEVIRITKTRNSYFRNGELFISQRMTELDSLLTTNISIIEILNEDDMIDSTAKFVPPSPKCFEFEEFSIYCNGKKYVYKLLDHNSSKLGRILRDKEVEFFNLIIGLIK